MPSANDSTHVFDGCFQRTRRVKTIARSVIRLLRIPCKEDPSALKRPMSVFSRKPHLHRSPQLCSSNSIQIPATWKIPNSIRQIACRLQTLKRHSPKRRQCLFECCSYQLHEPPPNHAMPLPRQHRYFP